MPDGDMRAVLGALTGEAVDAGLSEMEARMRQVLGLGDPLSGAGRAGAPRVAPVLRRRGFVRDGEIPVVMVSGMEPRRNSRSGMTLADRVQAAEGALAAARRAREAAEHSVGSTQASVRAVRERLVQEEGRRSEAERLADTARAGAEAARSGLSAAQAFFVEAIQAEAQAAEAVRAVQARIANEVRRRREAERALADIEARLEAAERRGRDTSAAAADAPLRRRRARTAAPRAAEQRKPTAETAAGVVRRRAAR